MERGLSFQRRPAHSCTISPKQSTPSLFFSLESPSWNFKGEMEKVIRDFFWDGGDFHPCSHLVKLKWTYLPIKLGGLGLGSFRHSNNALLMKWLWRFTQEETALWRRVIVSIYGLDRGLDSKNSQRLS